MAPHLPPLELHLQTAGFPVLAETYGYFSFAHTFPLVNFTEIFGISLQSAPNSLGTYDILFMTISDSNFASW